MSNLDLKIELPNHIIECPNCGLAWNVSYFTKCDCGAYYVEQRNATDQQEEADNGETANGDFNFVKLH